MAVPIGGHIGSIPFGNGGTYEGPGDTVPPGNGNNNIGMCTMLLPPVVCDATPQCDEGWQWAPEDPRCTWPALPPGTQWPLLAQGFQFTIGDAMDMLGPDCVDWQGNITICLNSPFEVREVHVFQSDWINGHDRTAPIDAAVSTAVCIGDDIVNVGWSFDEIVRGENCEFVQVCITFNAECLRDALLDWQKAGVDLNAWSGKWLFYVDFVSCLECDY